MILFQQIKLATGADLPRRSKRSHHQDLAEGEEEEDENTTLNPVTDSTTPDWRTAELG